jgi:hypothetical protein
MDRRTRTPINQELEALERELASLTLRVAEIRSRVGEEGRGPRTPQVGDRVRFFIRGRNAEGVVIGITAHRIRIRQDTTSHIFLRAPQNVILL